MDYYWLRKYFGKDVGNLICGYHHWNNLACLRKLRAIILPDLLEKTQKLKDHFETKYIIRKGKKTCDWANDIPDDMIIRITRRHHSYLQYWHIITRGDRRCIDHELKKSKIVVKK
jgi:hypothetical protein